VVANGRRKKTYIPAIRVGEELIIDLDRKVQVFSEAYLELLGKSKIGNMA
jgi:hypothetical protein